MVRNLIPAAVPGHKMQDVIGARVDYAQLDKPGQSVRIRLSSIVVGARNMGDPANSKGVEIAYSRLGQVFRVRAQNCVLASWNMMIPYICPEMPKAQKDGLHYLVKVPLVYTTVGLRNWKAFDKLGVSEIYSPGCYHTTTRLNPVVDVGGYTSVRSPNEPILVRMVRVPCTPGLDERSQHRLGHANLLATPFDIFERNIRDQLGRTLAGGGFDPAKDITSITVNRWPHGYAYEYNPLFDPEWAPGKAPHELGRARFGRITIANSDSGAAAYTDSAIDQAYRAVQELLEIT
jgi:spermidine dehydrogenase